MNDQYFPQDLISLQTGEVFVDCGAFTGDTAKAFIKHSKGNYKRIVCFEPDQNNIKYLTRFSKSRDNVVVYEKGTWSCDGELCFGGIGSSSSKIVEDGTQAQKIKVAALDNVPECEDATFIKMDIEGAEWETLHGAVKLIERNKPKMAVCIYHSDEDMLRIAEMIKEKWPEYRLYVRQHFFLPIETVLYVIP